MHQDGNKTEAGNYIHFETEIQKSSANSDPVAAGWLLTVSHRT